MKIVKKKKRRSDTKVLTKEGRLLKFLRESRNLSMRNAGRLLGKSDAIINHAENGRLDLTPTLILSFLEIYGYTYDQYQKMLNSEFSVPEHTLSECIGILKRLDPSKLKTIKNILDSF
jgi:transcriptional regulator with XRE-family HTH domain